MDSFAYGPIAIPPTSSTYMNLSLRVVARPRRPYGVRPTSSRSSTSVRAAAPNSSTTGRKSGIAAGALAISALAASKLTASPVWTGGAHDALRAGTVVLLWVAVAGWLLTAAGATRATLAARRQPGT